MLFCNVPLSAQTVIDDFDEEEEEADSLFVPIEDEIAVTDKEGNEEVIEFPEAMKRGICGPSESHPLSDGTGIQ